MAPPDAAFTDRTIEALSRAGPPGLPEHALLGIIEGSYRSEGGLAHRPGGPCRWTAGRMPAGRTLRPHDPDRLPTSRRSRLVPGLLANQPTSSAPVNRRGSDVRHRAEAYDAMAGAIDQNDQADVIAWRR
jgi:hypothetical protein